jgi:hypothetical protein
VTGYELVESQESAAAFHARPLPDDPRPQIWWNHVTGPALVLGSTQRDLSIVDEAACRAAGVEVVRRRSGGGAVLLTPGHIEWIDVIVPFGSPGWADDVHAPMAWLGEHLAQVVRDMLASIPSIDERLNVTVNRGGMVRTGWSSLICFDGLGPGEVLLGGHKLIGISQRRTRAAARLQCAWHSVYEPGLLVGLLAPGVGARVEDLQPVATLQPAVSAAIPGRLVRQLNTTPAWGKWTPRGR